MCISSVRFCACFHISRLLKLISRGQELNIPREDYSAITIINVILLFRNTFYELFIINFGPNLIRKQSENNWSIF